MSSLCGKRVAEERLLALGKLDRTLEPSPGPSLTRSLQKCCCQPFLQNFLSRNQDTKQGKPVLNDNIKERYRRTAHEIHLLPEAVGARFKSNCCKIQQLSATATSIHRSPSEMGLFCAFLGEHSALLLPRLLKPKANWTKLVTPFKSLWRSLAADADAHCSLGSITPAPGSVNNFPQP
ncbi:hypothetical protein AV530_018410 [Patagioenas fasciata monilis]|uniref:Uncharacterized protein n=1 Tax=Patagioenas fasciata monilis TaxID=372326 RepID=A0A1V4JRS5_PATFA|nr:hypothetical protein AV530_018410 [Patagioenas fasciata monilis]